MSNTELHFDAVIVGLGKTGLSCVRYLAKQGLKIAVLDSRMEPPKLQSCKDEFEFVPVYLGELSERILLAAEQIILSPGVSLKNKAIKKAIEKGIPVYGDIELFCQQVKAPIIAITGSNGKSTVTTLVAEMTKKAGIKTSVGGNLGMPVLDLLEGATPDLYVLELSSFQLETTFSLNAYASVVLNISPDHMDRYSTLEEYAAAKRKIYSGNGLMVINRDDEVVMSMLDDTREKCSFSLEEPTGNNYGIVKENNCVWLCQGNEKIIRQDELRIKGEHNMANALAAMALASSMNVSNNVMADTLKQFTGLEHRCQWVAKINDVNWYNDSKATNIGACLASIKGLCDEGEIVLIAGGDSKEADLSGLAEVVKQYVKYILLLGIDANRLASVFDPESRYEFVSTLEEAVERANEIVDKGDLVLLAPACASFDMFESYQHRGDVFIKAVKALEAC